MSRNVGKALESAIKEPDNIKRPGGISENARIFDNKIRRNIFSLLTFHPCLGLKDISDILNVSDTTVKWHIGKLVASGFLVERKLGRKRSMWPEGQIDDEDVNIFCVLSSKKTKALFIKIINEPGMTQKEYAQDFEMTHQGLSIMVNKLINIGLVSVMNEGTHTRYYPTRLLAEMSESKYDRTKAFRDFIIEKLRSGGEDPKVIKSSNDRLILEIGQKSEIHVMDIGLDPFSTALEI